MRCDAFTPLTFPRAALSRERMRLPLRVSLALNSNDTNGGGFGLLHTFPTKDKKKSLCCLQKQSSLLFACRSAMGILGWYIFLSGLIQRPESRELMRTESAVHQIHGTFQITSSVHEFVTNIYQDLGIFCFSFAGNFTDTGFVAVLESFPLLNADVHSNRKTKGTFHTSK